MRERRAARLVGLETPHDRDTDHTPQQHRRLHPVPCYARDMTSARTPLTTRTLDTAAFLLAMAGAALLAAFPSRRWLALIPLAAGSAAFMAGLAARADSPPRYTPFWDDPATLPKPENPPTSLEDLAADIWESREELEEFLRDTYEARRRPPTP
jgi:hypothetical protein